MAERYFHVWGKVQGVMFRQTVMRAAQSRNLRAAATNLKVKERNEVEFVLAGDNEKVEEIIQFMKAGNKLNSWGAQVERFEELPQPTISFKDHTVSTDNVDNFKWSPNVTFYI